MEFYFYLYYSDLEIITGKGGYHKINLALMIGNIHQKKLFFRLKKL